MSKFIHFQDSCIVHYPVGDMFPFRYLMRICETLKSLYLEYLTLEQGTLIIATKGTSGSILAGAVVTMFNAMYAKELLSIIIDPIDNSDHRSSLASLKASIACKERNFKIVVLDDFIQTGSTILDIIDALDSVLKVLEGTKIKYDALIISNYWDSKTIKKNGKRENLRWKQYRDICGRFKYIICNDPMKESD